MRRMNRAQRRHNTGKWIQRRVKVEKEINRGYHILAHKHHKTNAVKFGCGGCPYCNPKAFGRLTHKEKIENEKYKDDTTRP